MWRCSPAREEVFSSGERRLRPAQLAGHARHAGAYRRAYSLYNIHAHGGRRLRQRPAHDRHLFQPAPHPWPALYVPRGGGQCRRLELPSHQLSVYKSPIADPSAPTRRVLFVDAFTRLSGPAYIDTPDSLGFLLDTDAGVPWGRTLEYCGAQRVFDRSRIGNESETGLGYSGHEREGVELVGNGFDISVARTAAFVMEHAEADISSACADALPSPLAPTMPSTGWQGSSGAYRTTWPTIPCGPKPCAPPWRTICNAAANSTWRATTCRPATSAPMSASGGCPWRSEA